MVNGFHADPVALCHCFTPVLLRHLRPAIRRKILEMTKSMAEASSAAPWAARDQAGPRWLTRKSGEHRHRNSVDARSLRVRFVTWSRGGFDAGSRHAREGAGRRLDIAGQSDKLMDLF